MSPRRSGCLPLLLSAGLFGRGSRPEGAGEQRVPASLVVMPPTVTIREGGTQQLAVAVLDQHGLLLAGVPVTFETSDPACVTVSNIGVVSAVGRAGRATVAARSGALSTTIPVVVTPVSSKGAAVIAHDILTPPAGSAQVDGSSVEAQGLAAVPPPHPVGEIVAHVELPGAFDVAISKTNVVYVAQSTGGIARGDLPSFELTSVITGSIGAYAVAFDSNGTTAYVPGLEAPLTVVDVASNTILSAIGTHTIVGTAFATAVAPGDRTVVLGVGGAAYIIDVVSGAVSAQISSPGGVSHVAVHPTRPVCYANLFSAGTVEEIDMLAQAIVRTFAVGGTPRGMVVSEDGRTLYVANEDGNLDVVDLASGAASAVALGTGGGFGIAMRPDGAQLYVTSPRAGVVRVVDIAARTVLRTITVNGEPRGVAFSPDGRTAAVANESGWVDFIQ